MIRRNKINQNYLYIAIAFVLGVALGDKTNVLEKMPIIGKFFA